MSEVRLKARPTPSECWALWRAVLGQFATICGAIENSGGDEVAFPPETRRGLFDLGRLPFPVEGAGPAAMAHAFRLQAQALIDVAIPARRVAVAVGVVGSVQALEGLWHAEQARLTQVQLTRMGAGG